MNTQHEALAAAAQSARLATSAVQQAYAAYAKINPPQGRIDPMLLATTEYLSDCLDAARNLEAKLLIIAPQE